MKIDNKIDNFLNGPSIFLGIAFLILGLVFSINMVWLVGLFLVCLASFLLFTYSGTEIDTDKREIKSYYKLFGLIKKGKYQPLSKYKGVTLVPMKKSHTTYSISNRQTSTTERFFMIYLVNKDNKPELPIKKCKTLDIAQDSLDEFAIWLKIPVFTIHK